MSRLRANIATARRNWRPPPNLPHPRADEARTEDGRICPICLRWGRDGCREHKPRTLNVPEAPDAE